MDASTVELNAHIPIPVGRITRIRCRRRSCVSKGIFWTERCSPDVEEILESIGSINCRPDVNERIRGVSVCPFAGEHGIVSVDPVAVVLVISPNAAPDPYIHGQSVADISLTLD